MSDALIQTIDELLRDELRLPLAELRVTSNLRRLQEAALVRARVTSNNNFNRRSEVETASALTRNHNLLGLARRQYPSGTRAKH